jgi:hypothetical protein
VDVNLKEGEKGNACTDHCHRCNKIRGELCSNCNSALGLLGDDPSWLEAAAAYLRRHLPDCVVGYVIKL